MHRKRYQGKCFQDFSGSRTISDFDNLHQEIRQLFWNTRINICPLCVQDEVSSRYYEKGRPPLAEMIEHYKTVIRRMEAVVLEEERLDEMVNT